MSSMKSYLHTSSKRQKVQRTSFQGLGVRKLTSFSLGMGICVFSLWTYFHGSTLVTHALQSLGMTSQFLGFRLEDVVVEGRVRTDKNEILKKLELERGKSLLSINLSEAKSILEELSWVNAVRIERRFPDTIFIRISEKEPVALWKNQGKTYLVDRDGEFMEISEAHKYEGLLLMTGDKALCHVASLMTLLDQFPEIKSRVTAATHIRSTRWDLRLDNKVDVKLPEKEAERALAYLLDLEKQHNLMDREVMAIDMRLPRQLILRLTPEAALRKNNTGKDA